MSDPASPEGALIQAAYQDQVKALFAALFVNLQQAPITHMSDQQCVDKFGTGIKIAKRARDLALNALGASPAKAISVRTKKAKPA
jgi:hypothetical protein